MELEFLTVLTFFYKGLGIIAVLCVGFSSVLGPLFVAAVSDNPLWLLLYVFSPLIIATCYKLLWLF